MIKCDESCFPRCDYCIYARYVWQPIEGKVVVDMAEVEKEAP